MNFCYHLSYYAPYVVLLRNMNEVTSVSPSSTLGHSDGSTKIHESEMNFNSDDEPLGTFLFLEPDELEEVGISPTKCETIQYCVTNGGIQLIPPEREVKNG